MKTKILICLLAVTAIAGCSIPGIPGISGGPGTIIGGGRGLEITSFTAEPSTLYNGSTIRVTMDVENLGGTTTLNSTSFAFLTGSNINVAGGDNRYWHRLSGDTTSTECIRFDRNMKPTDIVKGTPGDKKTIKWSLRAPDISKGQTRTDSFIGRVYTDYETSVNGNIWVYNETEYDASKASGRSLNKATFTSTSGPVSAEVSTSPDPVILYGSDRTFSLTIKISNLQTGTVYKSGKTDNCPPSSIDVNDLNKVNVTLNVPDFSISADCKTTTSNTTEQELVSGRPTTVICELTAPAVTTFKSFPVTITVDYGYYTEATATAIVQGK
jgi:hypothetical protein